MLTSLYSLSNLVFWNRRLSKRKKGGGKPRASNPVQAFVEYLVVTDVSVFNDQARFINSTNQTLVFEHMRLYYAYVVNGISQRFINSFANDSTLNVNVKLVNYLFLTVNKFVYYFFSRLIDFFTFLLFFYQVSCKLD